MPMIGVTTDRVALYDVGTGFAFGPTFPDGEQAADFIAWWGRAGVGALREASDRTMRIGYEAWREMRLDEDGNLRPRE
jgi:hypothetical protein